jgi:hypothetical protein
VLVACPGSTDGIRDLSRSSRITAVHAAKRVALAPGWVAGSTRSGKQATKTDLGSPHSDEWLGGGKVSDDGGDKGLAACPLAPRYSAFWAGL